MTVPAQGHDAPGASQGTGAPGASQGDGEQPKALTLDDVNRAITGRLKPFETSISKNVEALLAGVVEKLDASFTQKLETFKPKEVETPEAKGKKGAEPDAPKIEEHPLVKDLLSKVQQLTKSAETSENARKAERSKARDISLRTSVANALTALGIPAANARKAVFELVDGTKRIAFESDESDTLVFKGADGEPTDFEAGIKGWHSSDDAKIYKPASGASGSGDRPAGKGGGGAPAGDGTAALHKMIGDHFGLG